MADVDIEASPDGLAHDFLLILRLGPIEDHAPPAATPPRQGHGNDFVHLLGREFAVSSTISRTRLAPRQVDEIDRKSTRLNSSHVEISYAVFCLKKKNEKPETRCAESR